MGIKKSRNKISTQFSMSSMTDLVFLLLIFFIIVSTLVTPYTVPVDLPTGSNPGKNHKVKIVVEIDQSLQHVVDGKVVQVDQLESAMDAAFREEPDYTEEAKKNIILRVDKTVDSENLVNVLVIAKQNGWGIAIATKPGQ